MSADEPTGWCHIPVDLLHPWNVPSDLRSYGVVFAQKGPLQTLLHSGVREGICLNNDQLKHLQALLRYPLPGKGEGHGKEGGVIKRDRAEALVRFFFLMLQKKSSGIWFVEFLAASGDTWTHRPHQFIVLTFCQPSTPFHKKISGTLRYLQLLQLMKSY